MAQTRVLRAAIIACDGNESWISSIIYYRTSSKRSLYKHLLNVYEDDAIFDVRCAMISRQPMGTMCTLDPERSFPDFEEHICNLIHDYALEKDIGEDITIDDVAIIVKSNNEMHTDECDNFIKFELKWVDIVIKDLID